MQSWVNKYIIAQKNIRIREEITQKNTQEKNESLVLYSNAIFKT